MTAVLVVLLGSVLGFVASRAARRPLAARARRQPMRDATAASVARNVGGALGRRRHLTAPELQRACFSEMIRHVRPGRGGATVVPAAFVLRLHPQDVETTEAAPRWFTDGLVDALRHAADDHGWTLDGTPSIEIEEDRSRRPGVPAALAVTPGDPAGAEAAADPTSVSSALVRSDTGARLPLGADVVTIGRSSDRAVVVDDSRVSRAHASVRRTPAGWTVTDDGSSNGTRVNGRDLTAHEPRPLHVGDAIEVGPVTLTFVDDPRPDAGPSRPLDDATRTRISDQVLPPGRAPGRP